MIFSELFTLLIYQPFFNILIFFYWLMSLVSEHPDMGVAVVALTILIRILLLPISLAEGRSVEERRQIGIRAKELEEEYSQDPVQLRAEMKQLFRSKPHIVAGEIFSLFIQVSISLMLWRIFASGLEGQDLDLVYPFMPQVELPFNLVFWGKFHLDHSALSHGFDGSVLFLNLLQSLCIFVLETLSIYNSPYPTSKSDVVRLQLVLPLMSFFIFMFLPAGKKLFVITTLLFSIVVTLVKIVRRQWVEYQLKSQLKEETLPKEESVLVDVK
jgi:YidC/Oxa1 family membrane protein insertase